MPIQIETKRAISDFKALCEEFDRMRNVLLCLNDQLKNMEEEEEGYTKLFLERGLVDEIEEIAGGLDRET